MPDAIIERIQSLIDTQTFVSLHVLLIMAHVILIAVAYSVYLERKISSYIQDRIGPNRVGFDFGIPILSFLGTKGRLRGVLGLGQPLADGIKFLLKEDFTPSRVDKVLFTLAPMIIVIPAMIGFVIIPWGGVWEMSPIGDYWLSKVAFAIPLAGPLLEEILINVGGEAVVIAGADVNIGIVYLLAVASLGVYGVTLGGWASNNKYSFLGGLRATAQMISYEIPMGLTLLAALLVYGTLLPSSIIAYQVEYGWLTLAMPLGMLLFFISILAEANRAPFDNAEAEQELVGGYHTEYSSMRFALYFLAEYMHMITGSAFLVLLFFGGYHLPFVPLTDPAATGFLAVIVKLLVFFGKVMLVVCIQMLVRWSLPRLRYDQTMMLGWQTLIPVSLVLLVATSVVVFMGYTPDGFVERTAGEGWLFTRLGWTPLFAMNVILLIGVYVGQLMLPRSTVNRRVPMYGSRFAPADLGPVATAPTDPMALEDRPVQGTVVTV